MAVDKTQIANMGLLHLGISDLMTDLDDDTTPEAIVMRTLYETTRNELFRKIAWPFCTREFTLNLVANDPTEEWKFSYRYPSSEAGFVRRIFSGIRNDTLQSRSPYRIANDSSGRLIYSDMEDAKVEYTFILEDVVSYPPDFSIALSYLLAYRASKSLTKGDPEGLGKEARENYFLSLSAAASNSFNEEQQDPEPSSTYERERNGDIQRQSAEDWRAIPANFIATT